MRIIQLRGESGAQYCGSWRLPWERGSQAQLSVQGIPKMKDYPNGLFSPLTHFIVNFIDFNFCNIAPNAGGKGTKCGC